MFECMRRREFVATVVTSSAIGVAGCSGGGDETTDGNGDDGSTGSSDDDQETEQNSGDGSTESGDDDQKTEQNSGDVSTESGDDDQETELVEVAGPAYGFSEGESYTYEVEWHGKAGEQGWEVLSVNGDELTIRRTYPTNEGQETRDISADAARLYEEMLKQITGPSFFRNMREAQFYAGVDEFAPGNTFTVDTSDKGGDYDSETVEVMGETTVNGIQCIEFTVTSSSGGIVRTVCAADGYPFPLSLHFEQTGVQLLDATLIDTSRS